MSIKPTAAKPKPIVRHRRIDSPPSSTFPTLLRVPDLRPDACDLDSNDLVDASDDSRDLLDADQHDAGVPNHEISPPILEPTAVHQMPVNVFRSVAEYGSRLVAGSKTAMSGGWFSENFKKNLSTLGTIAATVVACTLVARAMKQDPSADSQHASQPLAIQHDLALQPQPKTETEIEEVTPDFDPASFLPTGSETAQVAQPAIEQQPAEASQSYTFGGDDFGPPQVPIDLQAGPVSGTTPQAVAGQFAESTKTEQQSFQQPNDSLLGIHDAYTQRSAVGQSAIPDPQPYHQSPNPGPIASQFDQRNSAQLQGVPANDPIQSTSQRNGATNQMRPDPTAVIPPDAWLKSDANRFAPTNASRFDQARSAYMARQTQAPQSSSMPPVSSGSANADAQAGHYPSTNRSAFPPLSEVQQSEALMQEMMHRERMRMADQRATNPAMTPNNAQEPSRYGLDSQSNNDGSFSVR